MEAESEMYKMLERIANECQVVVSSGEGRGVEWFEKRVARIQKKLARARGEE